MLAKNTRALVTTVAVALITGVMATLLVALMPAPAQAQPGDVLKLLEIRCVKITGDEGGLLGDFIDEPYINADGTEVWSGRTDPLRMKVGQVRNLTGASATLSGQSARVQLWESDPGAINQPDDGPAEFFAEYTGGDERTRTLTLNGGEYEIKYVVDRDTPANTPPEMLDLRPVPGSSTQNRTPLISATVRDDQTDLSESNIKLFVDGNAETFSYDKASDKLTYQSAELAAGQHTVRIEATDAPPPQGLQTVKNWSFTVENTSPPPPPLQCSDGKDNDGDGKIDFGTGANNDPGCTSATDNDETDNPGTGNTAPNVDPIKPAPGSKIHNRSPLIAAKVSDAQTDLARSNIKLFVDGKSITNFSYDAATDRLSYRSGKLAYSGHTVKVKATDASGLKGQKTWRFKVVKR